MAPLLQAKAPAAAAAATGPLPPLLLGWAPLGQQAAGAAHPAATEGVPQAAWVAAHPKAAALLVGARTRRMRWGLRSLRWGRGNPRSLLRRAGGGPPGHRPRAAARRTEGPRRNHLHTRQQHTQRQWCQQHVHAAAHPLMPHQWQQRRGHTAPEHSCTRGAFEGCKAHRMVGAGPKEGVQLAAAGPMGVVHLHSKQQRQFQQLSHTTTLAAPALTLPLLSRHPQHPAAPSLVLISMHWPGPIPAAPAACTLHHACTPAGTATQQLQPLAPTWWHVRSSRWWRLAVHVVVVVAAAPVVALRVAQPHAMPWWVLLPCDGHLEGLAVQLVTVHACSSQQ